MSMSMGRGMVDVQTVKKESFREFLRLKIARGEKFVFLGPLLREWVDDYLRPATGYRTGLGVKTAKEVLCEPEFIGWYTSGKAHRALRASGAASGPDLQVLNTKQLAEDIAARVVAEIEQKIDSRISDAVKEALARPLGG